MEDYKWFVTKLCHVVRVESRGFVRRLRTVQVRVRIFQALWDVHTWSLCVCVCVYTAYVDGDGISWRWIVRDERKSKGRVESKGSERKRCAVSWWVLESSEWIGGEKYSLTVYSLLVFANSEQWRSQWFGRRERGVSVRNLKKRALVNTRA